MFMYSLLEYIYVYVYVFQNSIFCPLYPKLFGCCMYASAHAAKTMDIESVHTRGTDRRSQLVYNEIFGSVTAQTDNGGFF